MQYRVYKEIRYIAGWVVTQDDVLRTENARDAYLAFDAATGDMFRQSLAGKGHFRLDGSLPVLIQGGVVTTLHLWSGDHEAR